MLSALGGKVLTTGLPGKSLTHCIETSCCSHLLFLDFQDLDMSEEQCLLSHFSHVQLCATLWTIACWAPLSMGFSRQKYWSGLPCPPPGDLPNPGVEPCISYVYCTGMRVLYYCRHLGSPWSQIYLGSNLILPLNWVYDRGHVFT